MSNISLPKGELCTGCGACGNACSTGALKMTADSEGFLYPKIDKEKCVDCKACEKACPTGKISFSENEPKAYYAYSKDKEILRSSSSGGVFTHLAEYILSQNGAVVGACLDENQKVCHIVVESKDDLYKLRTSKYVQSDTKDVYKRTKELLNNDRKVLFTGTPCQTAALRQYLSKDYDNHYIQDIICHGVPSPGVWQEYLSQTQKDKDIKSISFRDKTQGWGKYSIKFTYRNGEDFCEPAAQNSYLMAFSSNLSLRPSCYNCRYKGLGRVSDITLADYWGVYTVHPELTDVNGTSLIFTHTAKGEEIFSSVMEKLIFGETECRKSILHNPSAVTSVPMNRKRDTFFKNLDNTPFDLLVTKLTKVSFVGRVFNVIYRLKKKSSR